MKPETQSKHLLNITKSKAKMWEYGITLEHHIAIPASNPPEKLFPLSIALLGDLAAEINRGHEDTDTFKELKKELLFSAEFFNSYCESKLIKSLSPKLRLRASGAYYLCDMPGNAMVLAQSLEYEDTDRHTEGLDSLLLCILKGDISVPLKPYTGNYADYINGLPAEISTYYTNGNDQIVNNTIKELRRKVYDDGTPEQLLLGDIIAAATKKKLDNAAIRVLPKYTGLDIGKWKTALNKPAFIKEFWPAQHLLGQDGVLHGKSAVIQMPTSAGKTKSIELIIRSAFLAQRADLAVIVAPFRALCREIKDSLEKAFSAEYIGIDALSDILQNDFKIEIDKLFAITARPQILIVTPEKLFYVLRHNPEITQKLKLIIFDEGHQFDTGKRGITYELLLTSLKKFIPADAQKVLISAVIPNASEIGQWLNGDACVVKGTSLIPTSKSIGFASWTTELGQIHYTKGNENVFYVPRVIEQQTFKNKTFPQKTPTDIALFLGLKLCANGGVAIFCGRKDIATSICKQAIEIFDCGFSAENLIGVSDKTEVSEISNLCEKNLGINSVETKSARLGIFAHHNNIPHGIRIAAEHAMREDKIRFVICTSTLAQGINLPIRYLIIPHTSQAGQPIKVRDFHNLIGRAGRSGKHIEGSILFADPNVYDKKADYRERWRWENAQSLLDINKSENCVSSLLDILNPIENVSVEDIIKAYLANEIRELAEKFDNDDSRYLLFGKTQLFDSIENFLLAHWSEADTDNENFVLELAGQTLAFHLADDEKKIQIKEVFLLLAKNIEEKIKEPSRKAVFGKTLYGVQTSLQIEEWTAKNKERLLEAASIEDFIEAIWPFLCEIIENNGKVIFSRFDPPEIRKKILLAWAKGTSFAGLLSLIEKNGVRRIWGTQRRAFTVEDMVDICENSFAFDGMLLVGAVIEHLEPFDNSIKERFQLFQKSLKYGLPTISAINIYELGFSDRFLSQEIAAMLQNQNAGKEEILQMINDPNLLLSINKIQMPSYYQLKLQSLKSNKK
ncbi:MAG: DEAD/DEAH box helicase [Endomicrobia bacterium]|nr:DEAD/DEAH box helicase [Endomicrobiia bacterium]